MMVRTHSANNNAITVSVLLLLSIFNNNIALALISSGTTVARGLPPSLRQDHRLLRHRRSHTAAATATTNLFAFRRGKDRDDDDNDSRTSNGDPTAAAGGVDSLPSVSPVAVVRRSLPLYVGFFGIGVLPAIDFVDAPAMLLDAARYGYFGLLAVTIVYLGAQRQDVGTTQAPVSGEGAAVIPFVAAATLAVLYAIVKYTALDIGALYRVFSCIFGWICLTEVLQPLVALSGAVSGESVVAVGREEGEEEGAAAALPPTAAAATVGETEFDAARFRASGIPAAALSLLPILVYLSTVSSLSSSSGVDVGQLRYVATSNDCIASAIALASLGQVSIDSFVTGAALLSGLFLYDAASVFGSDAMVTVAKSIEAPVKLLFAGATVPRDGAYPFSVLGLGDVLVPGVFVAMLRQFDVERWYARRDRGGEDERKPRPPTSSSSDGIPSLDLFADAETPYFAASVLAYAAGLGLTFGALALTGKGQPALFYIVPSLLVAALATATSRGELDELLAFKGSRAVAAQEARQAWKDARRRARDEDKD